MKLLLHICCAPCTIYPVESALKDGYKDITLFYFNPNIQPEAEFYKRKKQIPDVVKFLEDSSEDNLIKINAIYIDYDPKEFFCNVLNYDDPIKRCYECWYLRMKKTAEYAKQNSFNAFTSTLLVSPYQDNSVLKKLGEEFEKEYGLKFYYRDFQKGFKEAHQKAHEQGLYCQNYCGCVFSLMEREDRRGRRSATPTGRKK